MNRTGPWTEDSESDAAADHASAESVRQAPCVRGSVSSARYGLRTANGGLPPQVRQAASRGCRLDTGRAIKVVVHEDRTNGRSRLSGPCAPVLSTGSNSASPVHRSAARGVSGRCRRMGTKLLTSAHRRHVGCRTGLSSQTRRPGFWNESEQGLACLAYMTTRSKLPERVGFSFMV